LAGRNDYKAREVSFPEWSALLDRFQAYSVFHTPEWFLAIEAEHGASVELTVVEDSSAQCVAIWPLLIMHKGPFRIQGSPVPGWNTPYMGPIFCADCDIDAALQAFFRHERFRKGAYFSCKVLNSQHQPDLAPFGFVEAERLDTYCLDLSRSRDVLWNNLKSECRTRIRKATKTGLTVRMEHDLSFLDDFWSMAGETFAICGIRPTFSRSFVEEMWQRLHPIGAVCALSAFHQGQRIATLILPYDRQTMYYWAGVSFMRYRGLPAHNLLHWEAITHAQSLGLQCYDFVSTAGNAGRFKKTFGPECVHLATQWERTSSWLVRALKSGYKLYRERAQRVSA
jgi:hypothetical protein